MNIAVRRYLEHSRLAQGMVEDWQFDHRQAMIASDIEEFVQECIELAALTKRAWKTLRANLFDDAHCNDAHLDDLGAMIKNGLARTRIVFDAVEKAIQVAQTKGYAISNAAEFRVAMSDINKIEDDIRNALPEVDPEMVKRSQEAFARGECISAEDLLREAQSYAAT